MGYPTFNETIEKLKIENINVDAWGELWDDSQKQYSQDAFFLQKDFIIEQNKYLNLIDEVLNMILKSLDVVRKNEYLSRMAYHMYYVIFEKQHKPTETLAVWPDVTKLLGELTGGFDAIVYISGINLIKEKFKKHGISDDTLKHTLYDLMEKFYRHHNSYGKWYVDCQNWTCRVFKGQFCNIGRLQYEIKPNLSLKLFKNKKDQRIVAFFANSISVRKDGLINGTNGKTDENAFETILKENEDTIEGNPVIPTGYVSEKIITLPKNEWENVLDVGDKVLNIHIPRRGKMPSDECGQSIKEAVKFYKKHFPEEDVKAFHCSSWLLGNNLELLLDDNSNIIKFQRQFYLAPLKSDSSSTNFFVFGTYDISGLEPKTSLEKKILDFNSKGIQMHNGLGIIIFDHVDRYGEDFYRNHFITI